MSWLVDEPSHPRASLDGSTVIEDFIVFCHVLTDTRSGPRLGVIPTKGRLISSHFSSLLVLSSSLTVSFFLPSFESH